MQVYIGLGSNLGGRLENLRRGVRALPSAGLPPAALSGVWETAPVDCPGPEWFLNMVVRVETTGSPEAILELLLEIERVAGRVRTGRNEPRTLDLDLLLVGRQRVDSPELVLPHPRMWGRRFVLAPLAELAPGLRQPGGERSVAELELALRASQPDVKRVGSLGLPSPSLRRVLDPRLSSPL